MMNVNFNYQRLAHFFKLTLSLIAYTIYIQFTPKDYLIINIINMFKLMFKP